MVTGQRDIRQIPPRAPRLTCTNAGGPVTRYPLKTHFARYARQVDIDSLLADTAFVARFWKKVAAPSANGCRDWTAGRAGTGLRRPKAAIPARHAGGVAVHTYAYRVAWMLANERVIPEGFTVD